MPGHRTVEERMKRLLMTAGLASLVASGALAENVGVSMARFDDNFLTVLRNGMIELCRDAWTASTCRSRTPRTTWPSSSTRSTTSSPRGVDAIVVNPVDTSATQAMSRCRRRGRRAAGLCQPRAGQRRHPARQPGLRRLERGATPARSRPWRSAGCSSRGRQDRGQRLCDHGRAFEPGRRAAHPGHP